MSNLTREEIKNYAVKVPMGRGNIAPIEHRKLKQASNYRKWYDNMDEDKKAEFKKEMGIKAMERYRRKKEEGYKFIPKLTEQGKQNNRDRNYRRQLRISTEKALMALDPILFS